MVTQKVTQIVTQSALDVLSFNSAHGAMVLVAEWGGECKIFFKMCDFHRGSILFLQDEYSVATRVCVWNSPRRDRVGRGTMTPLSLPARTSFHGELALFAILRHAMPAGAVLGAGRVPE